MDKKTVFSVLVIFGFFAKGETLKCFKCYSEKDERCRDGTNNQKDFLVDCNDVVTVSDGSDFLACSTRTYRGLNHETEIERDCSRNKNLCGSEAAWTFQENSRFNQYYHCDHCDSDGCNNLSITQLQNFENCGKISDCNGSASLSTSIFLIFFIPFLLVHFAYGIQV